MSLHTVIPHGGGEIWAATLLDLFWKLVDKYGFDNDIYKGTGGNNKALQLIMDGLKIQPSNPSFLDARDAILAADQLNYGGANQQLIWETFARRGMGYSAKDGGSANSTNVVEAFNLPSQITDLSGRYFNVIQEPRNAGQSFNTQFQIQNNQSSDSGLFDVDFYISTNDYISTGDRYLGSYWIGNLPGNSSTGTLNKALTLPAKGDPFWNQLGDGEYHIGMIVDGNNYVLETNERNNRNTGEFKDYDGVVINNTKYVDLSGQYFNVNPEPLKAGDYFDVDFRIQNSEVNSSGDFDVKFYLSKNKTISGSHPYDRYLGRYSVSNVYGNSTSSTFSKRLRLPSLGDSYWDGDGTYYIGMIVDANDEVKETNEFNNDSTAWLDDYDDVRINNTRGARVSVKINRVKGDYDGWLNDSDFYSRISIGNSTWRTPTKGGSNDYRPPNWVYSRYVNGTTVPIAIQLWDSDGFLTGKDDHVDIDPKVGYKDVNILYNLRTGRITQDVSGYKGWNLYSRGESGKGQIWFTVNQS